MANINPDGTMSSPGGSSAQYPDSAYGNYDPGTIEINGVGQTGTGTGRSTSSNSPSAPAVKRQAETAAIVNPLHRFASYTYSWSLWCLSPKDYNELMNSLGPEEALTWKPSNKSFVVAQDGGRFPGENFRQPGTLGLNYHIQNVQFDTIIAPNKTSRSSNTIRGSLTILEPYGVTLIDSLVAASFDGKTFNNYCENPYMLQLEFFGYDDNGEQIPKSTSDITTYNKRFPIRIVTMKLEVTTRGTEYKIDFVPSGGMAHQSTTYSTTPRQFDIVASSVEEFFNGPDGLAEQWQAFCNLKVRERKASLADGIFFKIDPKIGISKIVNETKVSLAKANPKVKQIDLKNSTFSIPKGTPILDIITKVMAHSDFLIQEQLGLEATVYENADLFDPTKVFNAFKTTTKLEYGGVDLAGQRQGPAIDPITTLYPKIVTYNIHQYAIWNAKHPAAVQMANSYPYTTKYYNYIYTGLNTDITDIKINFDTTYYTAILAFTNAKASQDSTRDTDVALANYNGAGALPALNPTIFAKIFPQLAAIPIVAPLQYRFIADDINVTSLMNVKDRPAAQVAADVLKSIYTAQNQEMLKLDLTIVGDPTLIKQDDWLYVPDPRDNTDFSQWDISSADYTKKYGHIPMDRGQVAVRVIINSPVDMDLDYEDGNQGLAYPQPKYSQSLFSGQYIIVSITNKFANGKFEQVLNLARIHNDEIPTAFELARNGDGRNPVELGSRLDKELSQTNPNQPAGDTGDDSFDYDPRE
jgi:hypothetical protein